MRKPVPFGKKRAPVSRQPAGFFTAAEMAVIREARQWVGRAGEIDLNHVREIARR